MSSHLNEKAAEALTLTPAKRIEYIKSPRWIGYPRAKQIIEKLEDLLTYPKSSRMPNLLIVGDTNNGKTVLVKRFQEKHPAYEHENGDGVTRPVLFIQAPPVPDESRFYNGILELLFAPYKASDRVDRKQFQAIKLMRYVNVKMLVIDEIHHVLAGNLNKQKAFLNVIKYLGNELQVPIVGIGTKDAFRAIQTDQQLSNRFEPVTLPRWNFEDEEFLRLLASFERMLPLAKPSHFTDTSLAAQLHSMSEGYLGELSRLLNQAAIAAVKNGDEQITSANLKKLDWTLPSQRRHQPEKIGY